MQHWSEILRIEAVSKADANVLTACLDRMWDKSPTFRKALTEFQQTMNAWGKSSLPVIVSRDGGVYTKSKARGWGQDSHGTYQTIQQPSKVHIDIAEFPSKYLGTDGKFHEVLPIHNAVHEIFGHAIREAQWHPEDEVKKKRERVEVDAATASNTVLKELGEVPWADYYSVCYKRAALEAAGKSTKGYSLCEDVKPLPTPRKPSGQSNQR